MVSLTERRERDESPLAQVQAEREDAQLDDEVDDYDPTNAIHAAEAFFGAIATASHVEVSPSVARAL